MPPSNESNWQQRTDGFPPNMSEEYGKYPMVTAKDLRGRKERPRRVKMLTRDFIEGRCLRTKTPDRRSSSQAAFAPY
jgi:hypothetical protein